MSKIGIILPLKPPSNVGLNGKEDNNNNNGGNNGDNIITKVSGGTCLPIKLPVAIGLSNKQNATITKTSSGISLPIKTPISIGGCVTGTDVLSTKSPLKISVKEEAIAINEVVFSISEEAWDFKGIILEETIVDYKSASFIIYEGFTVFEFSKSASFIRYEDVRSRILTDIYMIDKNHVGVKWYGQPVDKVMILKKSQLDDTYDIVDTVPWEVGEYIVEVSEDATNIKVEGAGQTGESSTIALEDGFNTEVKTDFDIAINLKVHYLDTSRDSVFRLKVNY